MVDFGHRDERGAGVGLDEQFQPAGQAIMVFCAVDFEPHEALEGRPALAAVELGWGDAKALEVFQGEVDPTAGGVFAEVAENVGDLKSDAEGDGHAFSGFPAAISPDVDACQPDDAGDAVTVFVELPEIVEGSGFEVLLLPSDGCIKERRRHAIAGDEVGEGGPDGVCRVAEGCIGVAGEDGVGLLAPVIELLSATRGGPAVFAVGDVVDEAVEGVKREHRRTLGFREQAQAVIKVAGG